MTLKDLIRASPFRTVDSGICGCGAAMEGHPIWDNHSPTDIPWIKRDLVTAWFCWFMGMEPEK